MLMSLKASSLSECNSKFLIILDEQDIFVKFTSIYEIIREKLLSIRTFLDLSFEF